MTPLPLLPDFFIVGAPKCGTTALWAWLRGHPAVFMAAQKEPHFFGSDLCGRWFLRDRARYAALFAPAAGSGARRIGEASVFYLYSRRAAGEIRSACPDARIVALVRDPVTTMQALHAQLYYNGNEDVADFGTALRAEAARHRTRQAPNDNYPPEVLWYRDVVRFAEQIERYLDAFGPERVHVVVHDDMAERPDDVGRALLGFLGIDTDYQAPFPRANPAKQVRNARVHEWLMHPPAALRRPVRAGVPADLRWRVGRWAQALNTRTAPRPPLDPDLRRRLCREMAPDVERLGRLLGRDLSAWSRGDG